MIDDVDGEDDNAATAAAAGVDNPIPPMNCDRRCGETAAAAAAATAAAAIFEFEEGELLTLLLLLLLLLFIAIAAFNAFTLLRLPVPFRFNICDLVLFIASLPSIGTKPMREEGSSREPPPDVLMALFVDMLVAVLVGKDGKLV